MTTCVECGEDTHTEKSLCERCIHELSSLHETFCTGDMDGIYENRDYEIPEHVESDEDKE